MQPRLAVLLLLLGITTAAGLWRVRTSTPGSQVPDPEVARGVALLNSGAARGAAVVLQEAARRRPRDAEAAYLLGLAWFRADELRPAAEALKRSVELRPEFVEGHRRLGQVYTIAREYSLAAASLDRARALAPDDATTWIQIGRLYLTTGEADRAAAALTEATRLRPDSASAHALLGEAERRRGPSRWEAAEREYRRSLALDPRNADARHRLGWLAFQTDRPGDAVPHLRDAVRLDPGLTGAWYLLGQAARRAGQTEEARRAFREFERLTAQGSRFSAEASASPHAEP